MKKSKAEKNREFWYEQGRRDGKEELRSLLRDLLQTPSRQDLSKLSDEVWGP